MLSELPLELLDKVFGYLKEKDKLNLAQVNQQLESAFAHHAREAYKMLQCAKYTVHQLKTILTICGPTVSCLISNSYSLNYATCKLIAKHCVNLKNLTQVVRNLNFGACKYVLAIKGLKNITLLFNISTDYEESDLLQYINADCKLLSVQDISDYQAQKLRKLVNLEELHVAPKNYIRNVFKIVSKMKKLRVLHLYNYKECFTSPNQYVEYPELEEFELYNCQIFTTLPKCPKLKFLRLMVRSFIDYRDIERYAASLEHLQLYYHGNLHHDIFASILIIVLRECKRLHYLEANSCTIYHVFYQNLDSFIDTLRTNGFSNERRFELKVNGCVMSSLRDNFADSEVWNLIRCEEM
ncbi:uncharacterized protein LOC117579537 [Drosophila guanche]|uniref:F-box domain-containing protein n=1 Tax=Drosophila guanche TaxID=7266 RepID=A0A3B0J5E8_DROGU|nr:uncharacterized protein LOC117579537 [Drosophila guanche]SPP77017.1 Hypothetical predicted protein [Drosophila guanche]